MIHDSALFVTNPRLLSDRWDGQSRDVGALKRKGCGKKFYITLEEYGLEILEYWFEPCKVFVQQSKVELEVFFVIEQAFMGEVECGVVGIKWHQVETRKQYVINKMIEEYGTQRRSLRNVGQYLF